MKKLLSIEDYKKEILERLIEFRHEGADPFHDLAYEFTQWAIADDVRRYVHLRYSMGHNKENIIDGVYELIATISDHGLINSKIPEHKKIIKAEIKYQIAMQELEKKYDDKNSKLERDKDHIYRQILNRAKDDPDKLDSILEDMGINEIKKS